MGRAMIIIAVGAIIVMGIIQLGMNNQRKAIQNYSSDYAKEVQARNAAHSAIQLAMERINKDPSWSPSQGAPWQTNIDGAYIELSVDEFFSGGTIIASDSIRITSTAWYGGTGTAGSSAYKNTSSERTVVSTYLKSGLHFVPEPRGGLGLGSGNFTFNMGGSATINGNDASGRCPDLPAVTVPNSTDRNRILSGSKSSGLVSSVTDVAIDPNMSYEPVDELIARLANMPGVTEISGNYKGNMGSESNPGVFFVNQFAKLTGGIEEGHGILVIRSGGELEYEGALSVAGNFTFNGLIIFENAFDFTGRGTPDLNGSVLVGNTPGNNTPIDIDLSGNITMQYDCQALDYARIASANQLQQNRYNRVSTYE